jgi:DivIVA domain-containing protein
MNARRLGAALRAFEPRHRRPVDRTAVDGLRFTLAFRGYRMTEVDDVLDRLVLEIDERDRRIAELEGRTWPSSS